jgi:transposase
MTNRRHALSDEQWALLQPLLPGNRRRGHPYKGHRLVIDGILWILHTGAPWRDLPGDYGPWSTVFGRFNRWRNSGFWDRLLTALHAQADEDGRINWDIFCIDGSVVRAHKAAAGAEKKIGRAGRRTRRPCPGTVAGRLRHQGPRRLRRRGSAAGGRGDAGAAARIDRV